MKTISRTLTIRLAGLALSGLFLVGGTASAQPILDGRLEPVYFTDATTFDFQGFVAEAQATLYGLDNPAVDPTFVWVGWVISKSFNDHSYVTTHPSGGKHTSWPAGHEFGDLEESDLQRLLLFNTCGESVVDATMDLLTGPDGSFGTDSEYTVGMTIGESVQNSINGGDWSLFSYRTGFDSNLNNLGYCTAGSCSCGGNDLEVESPDFADEPNYVPVAACAHWEYDLIWEMRIDRSVFVTTACPQGGQLPIAPDPIELHASPSKANESPVALTRSQVSLGDFVWIDVDRDGVQDEGEPGIPNVRLNLYSDIDGDGMIDADLAVIDGYLDVDGDGVVNPDTGDDGSVYGVTIIDGLLDIDGDGTAGETNGDDDGLLLGLAITDGRVDIDFDGDTDTSDDGSLPGDHQLASTNTGIDGLYLFTQLGSGNYIVDVVEATIPTGLTATFGTGDTHTTSTQVIDGGIDIDGDGDVDTDDDGHVDGVPVENGLFDLDGDNVAGETNGDDSGSVNGVNVIDGEFDINGDGFVTTADDGSPSAVDKFDNTILRVIGGEVDVDRDGTAGETNGDDDGTFDGIEIIDGLLDLDGDGTAGETNGDDDGVFNGITVIDGQLDEFPDGTIDTSGNNADDGVVQLTDPEDEYLFADFGYAPTNPFLAAIGDFVWSDANDDGIQDLGEPGIEGVTVRLWQDVDGDGIFGEAGVVGEVLATTTTNASGFYLFIDLAPGDYVVHVEDGTGTPLDTYSATTGPQSTGSDTTAPITVVSGEVYLNADFGYFLTGLGLIENQVWLESDLDGLYEPATEDGISGVNIDLYQDVLGNGYIDSFDVIDGDLDMDFDGSIGTGDDGIAFGIVVFGATTSRSVEVIDGRLDLDGVGGITATDDGTYNGITVVDGQLDIDGGGVSATDDSVRDPVIASTVTDGIGQYQFSGLVLDDGDGDADYLVKVQDVDRTLDNFIKTTDGTADTDNHSQPDPLDVALSAGTPTVNWADFGFFLPTGGPPSDPDGLVGDFVWYDLDGDDVQDAGEPGIVGVTLELQRQQGQSFNTVGFTVTDADGEYQFPHLTLGGGTTNYRVVVSASNFLSGGALEGLTATSVNQDDAGLTSSANVDLTLDFGYWFTTTDTYDIGDLVWFDGDRDGFQDPSEMGIEGVTLDLLDGDGQVLATATTGSVEVISGGVDIDDDGDVDAADDGVLNGITVIDGGLDLDDDGDVDGDDDGTFTNIVVIDGMLDLDADGTADDTDTLSGFYLFQNLPDGDYTVVVTDTAGRLTGYDLTSGLDVIDTTLNGADELDVDFGYAINTATATIGDTVWLDLDPDGAGPLLPDGIQGPTEPGIGAVTVNLYSDVDGDGVFEPGGDDGLPIATTFTTDSDGRYLFEFLAAGLYFVDVVEATIPPNLSTTFGNLDIIDGAADIDLDGDVDADDDGAFQGIRVIDGLFDVDGVGGITTADDGTLNGIEIIDGYLDVDGDGAAPIDTDDDGNVFALVVLSEGENYRDADFGFTPQSGTAALGDFVWHDVDDDGLQDPGEVGIAGVEVILLGSGGTEIDRTTTGPDGLYYFTGLAPGDYGVDFDAATIPAGFSTAPTNFPAGETIYTVTLEAGDFPTYLDYGFVGGPNGTIGNLVWLDENDDGDVDVGEPGIEGLTLSVYHDVNRNGLVDAVDIIDGQLDVNDDGAITATDDGSYGGTFAIIDGLLDIDGSGIIDAADDGTLRGIAVVDGYLNVDGDNDANPDSGDDGSLPEPIKATTTTDSSGNYLFQGLPLDDGDDDVGADFDYLVDLTDIDHVLPLLHQTFGTAGVNDNGQVDPYAIALTAGSPSNLTADFGFAPATQNVVGSIGTIVWHDVDADGFRDGVVIDGRLDTDGDGDVDTADDDTDFNGFAVIDGRIDIDGSGTIDAADDGSIAGFAIIDGEVDIDGDGTAGETNGDDDGLIGGEIGIQGVRIDLWLDDGDGVFEPFAGDNYLRSTITDVNGEYEFTGLPAATYHVDVNDIGADGFPATDVIDGRLDMDGDGDVDTADDGIISGIKVIDGRLDLNNNGSIDAADDGTVAGIGVIDGEFDIDGDLTAGETNGEDDGRMGDDGTLAGFVKTSGTATLDNNSQSDAYSVTLTIADPSNFTADFGYEGDTGLCPDSTPVADTLATITGTTFEDAEVGTSGAANGVLDVLDTRVAMEVNLFRVVGGIPQLIGTKISDINGEYSFAGLPPGEYRVTVDPSGTSVQGFQQTTQLATGGVQHITVAALTCAASAVGDFGFYDDGVSFTPVTLAYFHAQGGGGSVRFEWMTATEVANIAFNLWEWKNTEWHRLNDRFIPTKMLDSLDPQSYTYEASGVEGSTFMVEDIDTRGKSQFHGPFELNRPGGKKTFAFDPIDWHGIGVEHRASKAARGQMRVATQFLKAGDGFGTIDLLVEEDGVYRATYEQLLAAGLDLTRAPKNQIALTTLGEPVPIHVVSQGNFGPGSYIEFIGEAIETLYTRTNVYTLQVDMDLAERIKLDRRPAPPWAQAPRFYIETLAFERELAYHMGAPNGDPWYDTFILSFGGPGSASFGFKLEDHLVGAAPVEMQVDLWGVTDWPDSPDHHLILEVNNVLLWDARFDGATNHSARFEIPGFVLTGSADTLDINLPGDTGNLYDAINFDQFSVAYPRPFLSRNGTLDFTAEGEAFEVEGLPNSDVVIYRISKAEAPVGSSGRFDAGDKSGIERIESFEISENAGTFQARFRGSEHEANYIVSTEAGVRSPTIEAVRTEVDIFSGEAEYLIISHPDFINDDLDLLVSARESQGLSVQVIDVEEIIHQIGYGIFDPISIQSYISFAAENMGTRYVLLVGGDTRDYLDHLGQGAMSFIPSIYTATGDLVHFAPADALYADIDEDGVADLAIGRFPARTEMELEALVTKTLEYDDLGHRKSVLLTADDYDFAGDFDFGLTSDQLATSIPGNWRKRRAYLDDLSLSEAREVLFEELNLGVALASYMGHSGPTRWTFDGLFSAAEANDLTNTGQPSVVTQWGCHTTYYVSPTYNTLAHLLLLDRDRGAAAVLGATTLTEARSERALAREIYSELFVPGTRLGDAILEAKARLAKGDSGVGNGVLLGWTLLGDPALVINP